MTTTEEIALAVYAYCQNVGVKGMASPSLLMRVIEEKVTPALVDAQAEGLRNAASALYRCEGPDLSMDSDITYAEWLYARADNLAPTPAQPRPTRPVVDDAGGGLS